MDMLAQRKESNRNEMEEQVLLTLLMAIIKGGKNASNQELSDMFEECMDRFQPDVLRGPKVCSSR